MSEQIIRYLVCNQALAAMKDMQLQSTPDNSNLQGKSKKVRVIGSSSDGELEENSRE